jgi:hypothetical protein
VDAGDPNSSERHRVPVAAVRVPIAEVPSLPPAAIGDLAAIKPLWFGSVGPLLLH